MPYYRCRLCGVTSYSAAGYSTPSACPTCGEPLVDGTTGTIPPAPELTRRLEPVPESAAEARRALAVVALPEHTRRNLALIVSELVTNAIRHARTPLSLVISNGGEDVRVEVQDTGPGFEWPQSEERPEPEGGLGLTVVDALSKEWGVDREDDRCVVWCVIPART